MYYIVASFSINYQNFKDDLAPGMRAFVEYERKMTELKSFNIESWYVSFILPDELKAVNEFEVYAVDRDGNSSEAKKLFLLDGVLVGTKPN